MGPGARFIKAPVQRPENSKNDKGKLPMIKRFAGRVLFVATCLIGAAHAESEAVAVNPDHPKSYTVQKGDTLWGISEKFLRNPWQWPEVWHINEQVDNPHLIYPGMVLRLVWKDGKPSLVADGSGDGVPAGIGSSNNIAELAEDGQTVRLRPRIRELPLSEAIPAIPLRNIEVYLNRSRVVTQEELQAAPYIVAGTDKRIVMGRGDIVYGRDRAGKWSDAFPEYGVFRGGHTYLDPVTGELLGFEARRVGNTRVVDRDGEVATLRVLESDEELRIEDRLLHNDQRRVQSIFYPRPAPEGVDATIIHIFGSLGYAARNDVVVINKGLRDRVDSGHVFSVLKAGEQVRDRARGDLVQTPPTQAGLVIVFRAFDKVSYALVTRSTRQLARGDILRRPSSDIQ